MLLAANCARFLTALVETIFKVDSLKLCVEFCHRRLLKFMGTGAGFTCFKPNVTWSTDNCLRRTFLLSFVGLSFKSIDFCLRNKFLALLGANCCRIVDIFLRFRHSFSFIFGYSREYFHDVYCNPIMYCDVEPFLRALCKSRFRRKTGFSTHANQFLWFSVPSHKVKQKRPRGENAENVLLSLLPSARVEQCPFTAETLFPERLLHHSKLSQFCFLPRG